MTRPDFDVIIAGAGAGGAATACHLGQAGLRVLVVEKARLPRYKACGGAIPSYALDRFPFDLASMVKASPADVRLTFPGAPRVDLALPGRPLSMVRRSEFDAFLLSRSGAEVLDGTALTGVTEYSDQVRVELSDRTLASRYLVGADGAVSLVARRLGLRQDRLLGGSLEVEVPLAGQRRLQEEYACRAAFALGVVPWGYAWVFPRGDCLSVGVARLRTGRADLHAALQREAKRLGLRLDGLRIHGHPLPCYQAPPWPLWHRQAQERLSTQRCLLVGDAAGLVDPLLGEGIRHAMTSARLAAEAVAGDDLSGYDVAVWQHIGHDLATAGMVADVYYSKPWLSYQLGVRNRAAVGHIIDVLTERTSYVGIGRRLMAATARRLLKLRRTNDKRHPSFALR